MDQQRFNLELMDFLAASPTPFHAVHEMAWRLADAGFERRPEAEAWRLDPGGRYFTTRNDSSIIAWTVPARVPLPESGLRMMGAHTDSPCLKVKPQPESHKNGYLQLGVEVYGGALLNPWFDRDLSMGGTGELSRSQRRHRPRPRRLRAAGGRDSQSGNPPGPDGQRDPLG